MSTRLQLHGLSELRAALRQLPEELTREASAIVVAAAEGAKSEIVGAYPTGPTGNLKAGVTVHRSHAQFTEQAIVRSRAKHAHLYEFGTKPRRTANGARRGSMPKAPTTRAMLPIVIRKRRQMVDALIEMVRRAGFQVNA